MQRGRHRRRLHRPAVSGRAALGRSGSGWTVRSSATRARRSGCRTATMLLDHGMTHDLAMEVIRFARERDLHVQAYSRRRAAGRAGPARGARVRRPRGHGDPRGRRPRRGDGPDHSEAGDRRRRPRCWSDSFPRCAAVGGPAQRRPPRCPTYLEFTSIESDKAAGPAPSCASSLGIAQDQTVAVGDGRNDVSMIAWAGLGRGGRGIASPRSSPPPTGRSPDPATVESSSSPTC